ncbi:glucose-6-phosphate 1-dehydrogenase [Roseibium hamelinense]|uniref:Glucose-6-phosphate 1-dehydrogenase n=1 Tax=Roseibium hamelinense TaxID=150831 RepID=A0A562T9Q1_9HYPH|nr:glucose-6-phosphate dehydrogenase [Roseibium hamelinense]MTI45328.1 glucose-6-phosphate dehydrogenase [Roseibium hamelinense]TWI90305.1 glucose-6-phosphate 1-dehydrogenase [Roseibium hamelinense]
MVARVIEVEEFDLVVFGASGDLAHRKLIPALYHRSQDGQVPEHARIICTSRRDYSDDEYRKWAEDALKEHVPDHDPKSLQTFLARLRYVKIDVGSGDGYDSLKAILDERPDVIRAFYLAVGPDLFGTICENLGKAGLVNGMTRVVIEKPIGKDGESARALNETVGKVFEEHQIFRIDHYLGKETVQNLMALRFANALFEPLWNAAHIDHVQITVAEALGVGGRAGYYDTAGALRDMVQNHILQLLCLVAMEPPESMDADSVRDEKLKVLKALAPITEQNNDRLTVRGRYTAGASAGGAVPGYLEELGHQDSTTETFVALKAEIANWRWAGVPFYLRTGKRLAKRVSEIVVQFRPIPHSIFSQEAGTITANRLIIRLQPDEGVQMQIMIKDPGPGGMRLRKVPLDMSFAEAFKVRNPDAYERLIMDVIRGNQTLFMRRDEVDAAWAWIDPILTAWNASRDTPRNYTAGTWGPSASIALVERDGRTWAEDEI